MKNFLTILAFLISSVSLYAQEQKVPTYFSFAHHYNHIGSDSGYSPLGNAALKLQFTNINSSCTNFVQGAVNFLGEYALDLVLPNRKYGLSFQNNSGIGLLKDGQNLQMLEFRNKTFALDNQANLFLVNLVE